MASIDHIASATYFAYDAFTCGPLNAATPEGKIQPPPSAALRVETDHC
jgi:hypothetical protein